LLDFDHWSELIDVTIILRLNLKNSMKTDYNLQKSEA
jgi:hypothetical protein